MTDGRVYSNLSSEVIAVIIARIHQVISLCLTVSLIGAWCYQFVTETKPVIAVIVAFFGWFFASTIFIDAIKTRKPNQTIYFIATSAILFVLCFAYLVLFIFILADEKSTDGIPYFIPSPILMIFQFFTCYISVKIYRELKK